MPRRPPLPGRTFAGLEPSHPSNKGLVAEFACAPGRFGGAAQFDLKANTKGALTGGAKWQPTNRAGGCGAIALDGTGYVNAGASQALNITGDISCLIWVKEVSSPSGTRAFLAQRNSASNWPFALFAGSLGTTTVRVFSDNGGTLSVESAGTYTAGVWQRLGYSRKGTSIRIYINGKPDSANPQTLSAGLASASPKLLIGAQDAGGGATSFFTGSIDDVMVYGRALSDAEFGIDYDQTRRGNPDRWRWLSRTAWFLPTGGGGNNLTRTASDAPSTSDAATRVFTGTRTASDGPTTADAVVRTLMLFRTAADAPSTADSAGRVFTGTRTASDAPATADVGAASKTFLRTASDSPATSDSASAMRIYLRTVMDSPVTLDAAARAFTGLRTATDHPLTADAAFASVIGPQQPPSEIIYLLWASGTPILASWSPGNPIMLSWQA